MVLSRPATFPEDNLRFVPRKRHNSRFPLGPPKENGPMIADLQPLVRFEMPQNPERLAEEAVTRQVDAQQLRTRSTRRLSRRISLALVAEDGDDEDASKSPRMPALQRLSPLKPRSPVKMTPRRVAVSPVKAFTVSATPIKVILEEPARTAVSGTQGSSPCTQALLPTPVSSSQTSSPLVSDPSPPLTFDQPTPDISLEP